MTDARTFINVIHANGPAAERADRLDLYGQFVGDWEMDIITDAPDGARHPRHGPVAGNWYGTTPRMYDPLLGAWRIFWIDPATNFSCQQIGKAVGPDIVQEGTAESGSRSRWRFTQITARCFSLGR